MRRFLVITSVSALAAAIFAACSVKVGAGPGAPLVGGSTFEAEFNPNSGEIGVPAQPGIPAGTCVKLTFFGAGGEVLGSTTVSADGSPADVPPGTEEVGASQCDPPEEEPVSPPKKLKRASHTSPGSSSIMADSPQRFVFRILPLGFGDGRGRYADYWAVGNSFALAEGLSRQFARTFTSEPCLPGIEPNAVVDSELLSDGRVRVSMFSIEAPLTLQFDWNEALLFDLDDASVIFASGWYKTTVIVPAALVNVDTLGISENEFDYRLGVPHGDLGTSVKLTVTP